MLRGLHYEAKVLKKLGSLYEVKAKPWLRYEPGGGLAQPDALLLHNNVYLVEVKLSFKKQAFTKLREFYLPIVKALYPGRSFTLVQITKNLPRGLDFPTTFIEDITHDKRRELLVHWG